MYVNNAGCAVVQYRFLSNNQWLFLNCIEIALPNSSAQSKVYISLDITRIRCLYISHSLSCSNQTSACQDLPSRPTTTSDLLPPSQI